MKYFRNVSHKSTPALVARKLVNNTIAVAGMLVAPGAGVLVSEEDASSKAVQALLAAGVLVEEAPPAPAPPPPPVMVAVVEPPREKKKFEKNVPKDVEKESDQ